VSDGQSPVTVQILEATIRTLGEKGSAQVSLRDIAREAGVALSQLHYYFGSREQLIRAAASYMMKQRIACLQAELARATAPAERVSLAIRLIRRQLRTDPSVAKILLDLLTAASWSPELAAVTRQLQDELLDLILAESEHTGQARLRTKAVARLVLGALDGLALQALQGAPDDEMDGAYAALEWTLIHLMTENP
jgi:AcrR family transcriptional regulator